MSGRRIHPNPAVVQPMTQIVDPSLAQPLGGGPGMSPPMLTPGQIAAQQSAERAQQLTAQDFAGQPVPPGGRRPPTQVQAPPIPPANEPWATIEDPGANVEAAEPPVEEEITELTADERAQFAMLMHVGKVTKKINVFTHPVVIESLTVGDDQRIGMYCRDYQGEKLAAARSYQIAVCAAGIRLVDGQPIYVSITDEESEEQVFAKKIEKLQHFYPATITEIYEAIRDLDVEFAELADKLKKRKG